MCDLCNNGEYSLEKLVISEQELFFKIILDSFGLYDIDNVNDYIINITRFEKINKFEINKLMNDQLKFFLEKGLLRNWEQYFMVSIQNRLNDAKEIDIEFFKLTYQILNITVQSNTIYCGEYESTGYTM